ncbi:MAG: acyltransferase family protein [Xanthobacteraceae bacterium]
MLAINRTDILALSPTILTRSGGIDALRAVFALWVVLFHLMPVAVRLQGADAVPASLQYFLNVVDQMTRSSNELHPAVLGFIVLSGYCIHRNGLRMPYQGIYQFGVRRCLRILPVFWLACLFPIVTLHFDVAVSPTLTRSIHSITELDPYCLLTKMTAIQALTPAFFESATCPAQANGALLTVMVEIVLYVLYACFFAAFIWRARENWVWIICAGCFICGLAVAALSPSHPMLYDWWQNSSVYGFLPYWWIGAALLHPRVRAWTTRRFAILLLFWAVTTLVLSLGTEYAPVVAEIRKLVFSLCVGATICLLDTAKIGASNPLSTIGRAGYSLYAFHVPLIVCTTLYGWPWWLTFAAAVAFAFVMYLAVERPFTQLGRQLANHPTAPVRVV